MAQDYYATLGVTKTATPDEIKKAYYKLAHKHHPHKGGDEKKMKEVNEAYQVLSNADKRKQYDQFGQGFNNASGMGGGQGFSGNFSDFAKNFGGQGGFQGANFEFDLGDVFGDLFGGSRRSSRNRAQTGADIEAQLNITFQEAVFGTEKSFSLTKDVVCSHCKGNKAEPGSKISTCSTCKGTGQVVQNIGFGIGFPSACPECSGEGKTYDSPCKQCHGRGVRNETVTINVKIPAGIDDGQSIRLSGRGAAGSSGQAGDLFLRVSVMPDSRFKRQGFEIITKAEISFTQAALGDNIPIETVDGQVKLKIPDGTQSGKVFKIKGKGVPHLNSRSRGDHLVEVIVKTPTGLNKQQKKLLEELSI